MPGSKGATVTGVAALLKASTATTNCAAVWPANAAGTMRLICVLLLKMTVAGRLLKVTETAEPLKFEPIRVASDPGTTGSGRKLAALRTELTVGVGGAGGAVMVRVTGIAMDPAIGPASM